MICSNCEVTTWNLFYEVRVQISKGTELDPERATPKPHGRVRERRAIPPSLEIDMHELEYSLLIFCPSCYSRFQVAVTPRRDWPPKAGTPD